MVAPYRDFEGIDNRSRTCVRLGSRIFVDSGSSLAAYIILLYVVLIYTRSRNSSPGYFSIAIYGILSQSLRFICYSRAIQYASDNFIRARLMIDDTSRTMIRPRQETAVFRRAWAGNEKALPQFIPRVTLARNNSPQIGCDSERGKLTYRNKTSCYLRG